MENNKTFKVTLTFESIYAENPLQAAKMIAEWCRESANEMTFDVINEETEEAFTVDLAEEDEDAVLPNK